MIYQDNNLHDASNIFESVELFNDEMEDEVGITFGHSLTCTVKTKPIKLGDAKYAKFAQPRLHWDLLRHADGKHFLIGEYLGDDADFMKRFLQAHRKAFSAQLTATQRISPKQLTAAYQRWHNRAMRALPGLDEEDDLLAAQDAYEDA